MSCSTMAFPVYFTGAVQVSPYIRALLVAPLGGDGSALTGACFLGVKFSELFALLAAERPSGAALLAPPPR